VCAGLTRGIPPAETLPMARFLADRDPISWTPQDRFPAALSLQCQVFFQTTPDGRPVPNGLEVVLTTSAGKPKASDMHNAHKARKANRASPVLIVVAYPGGQDHSLAGGSATAQDETAGSKSGELSDPGGSRAAGELVALCGPGGQSPPVLHDIEPSQADRLIAAALDEPDQHAAERLLATHLHELAGTDDLAQLPVGVRNNGLLATHHLKVNVPKRPDWADAVRKARPLLGIAGAASESHSPGDATDAQAAAGYQGPPPAGRRGRSQAGHRVGRALSGPDLVERLGFTIERASGGPGALGTRATSGTSLLTVNGHSQAVAVFCHDDEPFDSPTVLRSGRSPVETAISEAERRNLDWVILTRKAEIRLYPAKADVGVGRKARGEPFVELNLALLTEEHAGYLHLLFSAEALTGGTLAEILENSGDFAAALAVRLRERVYFETVPALASGVAAGLGPEPSPQELESAYEQVMVILFRLLFVAYAEDKGLLPYRRNDNYDHCSLKQIAHRLLKEGPEGRKQLDREACSLWGEVRNLWQAVDRGNRRLGVPAYNGGLFAEDSEVFASGATLAQTELRDADFGPALVGLLIDRTPEGEGLVDFRSLSVREFGTIYEGLLESRLAVAESDLTVKKLKDQEVHAPARKRDKVAVAAGEVYLHNLSGSRKATGSYFTKPFAVEHLLDHALEPALDDHLKRLDELRETDDDAALAKAFFDFRCADIAMGSGHFLVAALDRIEARLSGWLAAHPLPAVTAQLERLHNAASIALCEVGVATDIEHAALMRRQVARHCVYGVDRAPVAVELARLAVWIHTFVPGLPLSFLDHNLVCGDSLTGVGSLRQAEELLEPDTEAGALTFTSILVKDALQAAESALERLALTSDANKAEIEAAREAHREAREAVAPARALFDLVTAYCAGASERPESFDPHDLARASADPAVRAAVDTHRPLHFPAAFPEVFLRDRPGFDCLLGNPPWEKVTVERQVWWGRYLPGIRGQSVQKMNAAIGRLERQRPELAAEYQHESDAGQKLKGVLRRAFPNLGMGHTDTHRAFAWRFWQLAEDSAGQVGIVLPRTALADRGNAEWRQTVLNDGQFTDITMLVNKGGWVFDDVHGRYTVSLCSLRKGHRTDAVIRLAGPFTGISENRSRIGTAEVTVTEFATWSEMASFPLLSSADALGVFRKLKSHPRLDRGDIEESAEACLPRWLFRPVQGDLNATTDKTRLVLDGGDSARLPNSTPHRTDIDSPSIPERSL